MGSTKAVSGFQKEAGGAVLARRPLFWVLCRPNLTASSQQSWEEVGDPPDVCLRTPRSQKSLSPLRGHGLVQLQCGHALVTGRAFAARAVKVPQHLFWGHVSEIQNVPVWLFQLTPSRGFSPVSIAGAPSPSTRRQETEEQHRRGRPQAVRPGPGAVSTRGSPHSLQETSGASAGGARATALASGRSRSRVGSRRLFLLAVVTQWGGPTWAGFGPVMPTGTGSGEGSRPF